MTLFKKTFHLDLYAKLTMAEEKRAAGDRGRTLNKVMKDLRKQIRKYK